MTVTLTNATVYEEGRFSVRDVMIPFPASADADDRKGPLFEKSVSDGSSLTVFPGFADVHVHLREPGFSYKETIASGSLAGAAGGYTALCAMPNLSPVPDGRASLGEELALIRRDAVIAVKPYGAITVGERGEELADLEGMAPDVCAFSDDGRGIRDAGLMREAMARAAALGKILAAHCEDTGLVNGGYIHAGRYAEAHGHRGICSESEWRPIERDLKLAAETGCRYHVCHVSTRESAALIREAKRSGVDVTCETAPHYLTLCEDDLREDGRFKMNPPLRGREDRDALIEALCDGTIDMIATDHAPHSEAEKAGGLRDSLMGVVGLETAFPVLYTALVKERILSLARLTELMTDAPRRRFGLTDDPGFTAWDLNEAYTVDPATFRSKGRATPFAGRRVFGRNLTTVWQGRVVYRQERS